MSPQSPTRKRDSSKTHIGPFKEQEPFLWDDKRYHGFVSGVGVGKTHIGICRLVKNVKEWNPGEMGAVVAPARRMINDAIIPLMQRYNIIGEQGPWRYESPQANEPGIHAPNGARVLILSAENQRTIERLKGLNLAHWWIDERAEVPQRAQEILEQRLRVGEYRNGYITTTPKGKDSVYDFFVGDVDAEERAYGEATLYETEDRRAIVGVPTYANPYLPDDYKEAMQADMPDDIQAQEVEGRFVEIGSGVFDLDMLEFVHPSEISEDWPLRTVIGVDPAATVDEQAAEERDSDYWAVVVAAVHARTNTAFVTDTAHRRGMGLQEGVAWIKEIVHNADDGTVIVESNQSQVWLQQALSKAGVNALPDKTTRNKENKLLDLALPLSDGTVKFVDWEADSPAEAAKNHPYQELVSQALAFPDGSHDDLLDALYLTIDNSPVRMGSSIISADPYNRPDA